MGLKARLTATIGSTVKPIDRRCGATISSPLQIVGVSHCASTSRSARVKDVSGMFVSPVPSVRASIARRPRFGNSEQP